MWLSNSPGHSFSTAPAVVDDHVLLILGEEPATSPVIRPQFDVLRKVPA